MDKFLNMDCDINIINSPNLAFLGDAIFDLMVREMLVSKFNLPVGKLNDKKIKMVSCHSQSIQIKKIMNFLTEQEISIYKRGRNTKLSNIPKNASVAEYHNATGLEVLFGFLYLKGSLNRLKEIFLLIVENTDK